MALSDLYLVGLGIQARKHLTAEARAVLGRCRIILHVDEDQRWLKGLNPAVISLKGLYFTGDERRIVYDRLVQRIVDEMAQGAGVAFVTYGHPLVFDRIAGDLRDYCRRHKRSVRVVPGISSLDTLGGDLGFDYGAGVQIYDSTTLVRGRHPLNNRVHALLFQVGEYGFTRTADALDRRTPGRYASLIDYLRRYYPASHPVFVVYSDDGHGAEIHRMRLDHLDRNRRKIFPGTTLAVPPIESPPIKALVR